MPTDPEMFAYAKKLPDIYRAVMAAFPDVEPGRKAGYGLATHTLATHFANSQLKYSLEEVQRACMRLADEGFLEIKNEIFAHPTDLGEQLIAAITDRPRAPDFRLPELPARTW